MPLAGLSLVPLWVAQEISSGPNRRKDFSLEPPTDTILDVLKAAGYQVVGVGKIEDIFAHRGLTMSQHTGNNMAGVDAILEFLEMDFSGLIFANLVDFDALYGHRNDPVGYAKALIEFDRRLPEITRRLRDKDVLMITADHGTDPTDVSTDHTRERVPILNIWHTHQSKSKFRYKIRIYRSSCNYF